MKRKLNICIVHPNRNAYSETFIRNHINYLPGNIFDLYGSVLPAFNNKDERIADLFIHRNFPARLLMMACKILPAFVIARISSSIKGYPYDENFNKKAFEYYLKKNKIDVVLAEFMGKGSVAMDSCSLLSIPLVVHSHGGSDIASIHVKKYYSQDFPALFKKASFIISVDSYSSACLLEMGLQKNKLVNLGYGIDTNLFEKTTPSLNGELFFAAGRFVGMKAPHLTIIAFSKVLRYYPNAKLVMAGDGVLYDPCIQLVKALQIEKNVELPGVLDNIAVSKYMHKARAFVQHSLFTIENESEGTPLAILEAMACGLPVISTYHNGIADTIEHGHDGLLVKENDIDKMTFFMQQVLDDPSYADKLGNNAREKIENNFELSMVIAKLYKVLAEAVETANENQLLSTYVSNRQH